MRNLSVFIIILTIIFGIVSLPFLPNKIAINWQDITTPVFFLSKYIGIFLIPMVMVINWFIHRLIVHSIKKEIAINNHFILLLNIFFLSIQSLIILANLGIISFPFDITAIIFGILLIILAIPMRTVKMNTLFGIRTPWSSKNEEIWRKSNELGSKLFIILGVLCIVYSLIIPQYIGGAVVLSTLVIVIIAVYGSFRFSKIYN